MRETLNSNSRMRMISVMILQSVRPYSPRLRASKFNYGFEGAEQYSEEAGHHDLPLDY